MISFQSTTFFDSDRLTLEILQVCSITTLLLWRPNPPYQKEIIHFCSYNYVGLIADYMQINAWKSMCEC